jgi:hypothetical protein
MLSRYLRPYSRSSACPRPSAPTTVFPSLARRRLHFGVRKIGLFRVPDRGSGNPKPLGGVGLRHDPCRLRGWKRTNVAAILRAHEMVIHAGSINRDHMHLPPSIPPSSSVSRAVQYLKGRSSHKLLSEFRVLRKRYYRVSHRWRSMYDHVLVDEYQDLNKAEQAVVDLLCATASLCIVGDDDQSLYSFKHAHPEGIRTFPQTHTGTTCYRCPTVIVSTANALIAHNVDPEPRKLTAVAANGPGEMWIVQVPDVTREANIIAAFIETSKSTHTGETRVR